MKIAYCVLLGIVLVGCGPKSDEEKAHDLITANLKATLPDFNAYSSLNFGNVGTASLPFEETDEYTNYKKIVAAYGDSVLQLQSLIAKDSIAVVAKTYKEKIKTFQDSASAMTERNRGLKQSYTPEKLFKLTHAYNLSFKDGTEKKNEDVYYLDKDLTKVVKVQKVY